MNQAIDRRGFLGSLASGVAAIVTAQSLARTPILANDATEIDVDWFRGMRPKGTTVMMAEVRFRVPGQSWQEKSFSLTKNQPVAWLTDQIGISFHSSLWDDD